MLIDGEAYTSMPLVMADTFAVRIRQEGRSKIRHYNQSHLWLTHPSAWLPALPGI